MSHGFTCCRCSVVVTIVNTVSEGNPALEMFKCKGSTWHDSWHQKATPKAQHIICGYCENALRAKFDKTHCSLCGSPDYCQDTNEDQVSSPLKDCPKGYV